MKDKTQQERGSAMVMAVFVLFLLASTGAALLFLSSNELQMSQASVRSAEVFYLAEAAVEAGRSAFYKANVLDTFDDDLAAAAGVDTNISIVPGQIEPIFDANDNLTGLTGVGDDAPLVAIQTLPGGGSIAAFLMNDPLDGRTTQTDTNDRVIIVGVAAGRDRSFETVEALIERRPPIPLIPPATITLLGKPPTFSTATSKVKTYEGEDCAGAGVPGLYLPVFGVIGSGAASEAEAALETNPTFQSGPYLDDEVVADLTDGAEPTVLTGVGTIDPKWNSCENLRAMLEHLEDSADYICRSSKCAFPDYGPDTLIFIDGDYAMDKNDSGRGILVCTGELTLTGGTSWNGLLFVVGEGSFRLNGAGKGVISGSMLLADIAGPDETYGTSDDCKTGSDGLGKVTFDENGGGNSATQYCTTDLTSTNVRPYEVVEFLQH
jgi:hypothetical protein